MRAATRLVLLFVFAASLGLGLSCSEDNSPQNKQVALKVSVSFDEGLTYKGEPSNTPTPQQDLDIDRIQARALDGEGAIVAEAEDIIEPSDTRFSLELSVPPANFYTVIVEAISDQDGVQFRGEGTVENVSAASESSVEILLADLRRPSTPTNLAAISGVSAVGLSWDDNSDNETAYHIERMPEGGSFTEIAILTGEFPGGTVDTTDESLTDRDAYTYRVRGRNANGFSDYSNETTGRLVLPPPTLEATALNSCEVELLWTLDISPNPETFVLERRVGQGSFVSHNSFPGTARGAIDPVDPDTEYGYRIRAEDEVQLSPFSNEVSVTTGTAMPVCSLTLQAIDFGTVPIGEFRDSTVVITNTGNGFVNGFAELDKCDDFEIRQGGGSFSLGENESHAVVIRYTPSLHDNNDTCSLTLGTQCGDVSLSGTGLGTPVCEVSTTDLDFGDVEVGQSVDLKLTVSNTGTAPVEGNAAINQCSDFELLEPGSFSIAPASSQEFTVRFTPSVVGELNCTLEFGTESGCSAVPVGGVGFGFAVCEVSRTSIDFGTLDPNDDGVDEFLILKNTGLKPLSGEVALSKCSSFFLEQGEGPFTLAPGDSIEIIIFLDPFDTGEGTFSCDLLLGTDCPVIPVTAVVEGQPLCAQSAGVLDFGTVAAGEFADRSFLVVNVGGGKLEGAIGIDCGTNWSILEGGGDFSLAASETLSVTVRFQPSTPGTFDCTILNTAGTCRPVEASGEATAGPSCSYSPASLDFGTVALGDSANFTFDITNSGGGTLRGTVPSSCDDFLVIGGTGAFSLGPLESRTVTVSFSPLTAGQQTCELDVGTECSLYSLTGFGNDQPICTIDPPSLVFPLTEAGLASDSLSYTITNTGGGTLTGFVNAVCDLFPIQSGFGSYSLQHGESHTVWTYYLPIEAGSDGCEHDNGADCPKTPVSGTASPSCKLSVDEIDFGDAPLGFTAEVPVIVENVGTQTLTGVATTDDPKNIFVTGAFYSIPPGQSHQVTFNWIPDFVGHFEATASFGSFCDDIPIFGYGEECILSPDSLDFGSVALQDGQQMMMFQIENVSAFTLNEFMPATCGPSVFISPSGSYSIPAGQTANFTVTFDPSIPGNFDCEVIVANHCPTLLVDATAFDGCVVAPNTINLGDISAVTLTSFTVTNTSNTTISGFAIPDCQEIAMLNASFLLGPAQSATLNMEVFPITLGPFSCTIDLQGTSCPTTVTVTGNVVSSAPESPPDKKR